MKPLSGSSGRRLAGLSGLTPEEFRDRFDRVNLVGFFPGKAGKGDRFPASVAKARLPALAEILDGRRVILLGRRVAAAFGHRAPPFHWVERADAVGPSSCAMMTVALCPHPSGVNHFWNQPANRDRARSFWTNLAGERIR